MGLLKKCKQPSVDDHCVQPSADGRSSVWLCQAADERIFGAYICLLSCQTIFLGENAAISLHHHIAKKLYMHLKYVMTSLSHFECSVII